MKRCLSPSQPDLRANAHHRSTRNAKSLIEVVVVISIMAVIASTAARLIFVLFRAERTATHQTAESVALAQLAGAFRRDVHAAADARLAPAGGDGQALELDQPGGLQIRYLQDGPVLLRQERRGDDLLAQQRFRLRDRSFRFGQPPDSAVVSLACDPVRTELTTEVPAARVPVRIVAVVGRDYRREQLDQ
jgi:type II secretory pathway pseudopilin PulG